MFDNKKREFEGSMYKLEEMLQGFASNNGKSSLFKRKGLKDFLKELGGIQKQMLKSLSENA